MVITGMLRAGKHRSMPPLDVRPRLGGTEAAVRSLLDRTQQGVQREVAARPNTPVTGATETGMAGNGAAYMEPRAALRQVLNHLWASLWRLGGRWYSETSMGRIGRG